VNYLKCGFCITFEVSWTEYKKNGEVLKTVETRSELMDTLRNRQKRWLERVLHHGSLVRRVSDSRLPGKKGRGRPKEMLLSWLLQTSEEDMDYSKLKELAQERARWCRWKTKTCSKGRIQHKKFTVSQKKTSPTFSTVT